MERGSRNRESDIYSTFVVHDDVVSEAEVKKKKYADDDIYSTMVYKDDGEEEEDDDEDNDASLPPLLKRLPKDFGVVDFDDDDEDSGDFGTVIVKKKADSKPRRSLDLSFRRKYDDDVDDDDGDDDVEDEEEGFGTFVVKKKGKGRGGDDVASGSGSMVRRSGVGNVVFGMETTMGRAVASMQAIGDGGGRKKKGSASGASSLVGEDGVSGRFFNRGSTSSIPECVTREDPSTRYELLNELGKLRNSLTSVAECVGADCFRL